MAEGDPRESKPGPGPLIVWVTTDREEEAWELARGAVAGRLAASAHVTPTRSCYRWKGEIHQAEEFLVAFRSHGQVYDDLEAWIHNRHHYDLPEIIALPVSGGLAPYLDWMRDSVGRG